MTKRLALLAACVLVASVTLGATWWPYPVKPAPMIWYGGQNAVFMAVDRPAPGSWGLPNEYFAGWAFNCNGAAPTIHVWRFNPVSGIIIGWPSYELLTNVQVVTGLYRPDVAAAYAGLPCAVTPYSGWHVYFPSGHPTGVQAYFVQAYSEGGTWNPYTGEWVDASAAKQFFVVIQPR